MGLDKNVTAQWRKNHHSFVCPNGHSLSWNDESDQEKELKALKEKVKELETKLQAAQNDVANEKKRADELAAELEIWKPSSESASN
jgi:peptidoglycan hydrolase CwlO-like protein